MRFRLDPKFFKSYKQIRTKISCLQLIPFLKRNLQNVFTSILVLVLTFYLINFFYYLLNRYSFQKFSEEQIRAIVEAQLKSDDYEFSFVKFGNRENKSIAVLVNSNVDWENWSPKNVRPANLSIFEIAAKNPFERILFDTDLYQLKYSWDLIPPDSKGDYELVSSSLRVIDLSNDQKEEIFFCLMFAHGGSGTYFECSIFDGEYFYSPFPNEFTSTYPMTSDSEITPESTFSNYDFSYGNDTPVFSTFGSDDTFHFNENDDSMTFLKMIWADDDECHWCAHRYDIYHYKLIRDREFIWDASPNIIFSGGLVKRTEKTESPFDYLIKDYIFVD